MGDEMLLRAQQGSPATLIRKPSNSLPKAIDLSLRLKVTIVMHRLEGFHGSPWVRCAVRACRSQQGRGPRSHPRRVTMKVTPTDYSASLLGLV